MAASARLSRDSLPSANSRGLLRPPSTTLLQRDNSRAEEKALEKAAFVAAEVAAANRDGGGNDQDCNDDNADVDSVPTDSDGDSDPGRSPSRRVHVVLRVVRARLTRSFCFFSRKMAPFVEVTWLGDEGSHRSRSRPHRRGHKDPSWDYESLKLMPLNRIRDSTLEIKVLVDGLSSWVKGEPTHCGSAAVPLSALLFGKSMTASGTLEAAQALESAEVQANRTGDVETEGQVHELTLKKNGETTGVVWVQAKLLQQSFPPSSEWHRSDLRLSRQLKRIHAAAMAEALSSGGIEGAASSAAISQSEVWSPRSSTSPNYRQGSMPLSCRSSSMAGEMTMGTLTLVEPEPSLERTPNPSRRRTRRRSTVKTENTCHTHGSSPSAKDTTAPVLLSRVKSDYACLERQSSEDKLVRTKTSKSVRRSGKDNSDRDFTRANAELFQDQPVTRLGTSGGTAPFFRLELKHPLTSSGSLDYFIGKDLSHARDEVDFYESAHSLLHGPAPSRRGFQPLLSFMLDYAGVGTFNIEGAGPTEAPKELLVMRNMRDGYKKLRMLDIKIGEKTSSAGWQGKSRMAALKQDILDGLTNSKGEGFRLEGFDSPPAALESMDPLLDLLKLSSPTEDVRKKAQRFMLQRMPASEVFMHLTDMHQDPGDITEKELSYILAPAEASELALHEICSRLAQLALACRQCPSPQKWVGSSVALGFECGQLPRRMAPENLLRDKVTVSLFDWGRSELNRPEMHAELEEVERQDRAIFWQYYMGGIDSLAWEAARNYRHHFGSANGWFKVDVVVYDFDSMSESDFIGQGSIHLAPIGETTIQLTDREGRAVKKGLRSPPATLTYKIEWRNFPSSSRLKGAWRVTLLRAANLPGLDHFLGRSTSDPFAVLTAFSQDGRFRFQQQTCVIERRLDPVWEETFELPVARDPSALHTALNAAAPGLGAAPLGALLLHDDADDEQLNQAFRAWSQRLDLAANCVAHTTAAANAAARKEMAYWDKCNSMSPTTSPVDQRNSETPSTFTNKMLESL